MSKGVNKVTKEALQRGRKKRAIEIIDEENTRVYRGRRHCRACARERHHQRGEV